MQDSKIREWINNGSLAELAVELEALKINLIIEYGSLRFDIREPGAKGLLSQEELEIYLKDPTAFLAEQNQVSVKHYLAWRESYLRQYPQCWATTKSGLPCRSMPSNTKYNVLVEPADFDPNMPVYCSVHEDSTASIRRDR